MPHTYTWTRERLNNRPRAWTVLVVSFALILAQLALVGQAAARTRHSGAGRAATGSVAAAHQASHRRKAAKPKKHSKIKSHKHHKRTRAKQAVKRSKKHGVKKASGAQNNTKQAPSTSGSGSSTAGSATGTTSSASTTGTVAGTVLFNGSAISSWWLNQSASPTRVQSVPDPSGAAGTVQQFTTYNSDVAPLTPTNNPRSQLCTPQLFKSGQQYWESFEVYVPTSFNFAKTGWLYLESAVYGKPFNGTPPVTLSIENGAFRFQRTSLGGNPFQIAWTTPVVKGQWYRFTWHFDLSASGWVELYVNDVQEPLLDGKTQVMRLPIAMLDATDSKGPWYSQEQVYYQHGAYPSATIDFKNYAIGTTQAAAES